MRQFADRLLMYLDSAFPGVTDLLHLSEMSLSDHGRKPYKWSLRRPANDMVLFFSTTLKHALVEITGQGCERFRDEGTLDAIMRGTAYRATRLDVASDFLNDVDPLDFTDQRDKGRFKSFSKQVSESGTTSYVGAKTSDRYARVYRYNPPHERAHLLRIEYVFKAEVAKSTIPILLDSSPTAVSVASGVLFGWVHPAYLPASSESVELASWRPERHEGKTLFWLNDTVAKTLIRLHKAGSLDATDWLRDNVLIHLVTEDDRDH